MNPTTCKSCGLPIFHGPAGYAGPQCMCRWTNAAPRQPGGEGLEVVAYECLSGFHVSLSYEPFGDNPVPLWRAPDAQRAIAELREECTFLKDCQENAMLHMTGLVAERDTLRQQLAEARDEITQHSNDLTLAYMKGGADMRQQRDKLAKILRDLVPGCKWRIMRPRIDAALAEIDNGNE